jgi:hypothetical protein
MTTEQLAAKLGLRPHTLRTAYCLKGGYYGVKPTKLPNRHLAWPDDSYERLLTQQAKPNQVAA